MALGDFNKNNDNNKKNYDPTVYSPIQFKNGSGIDPSRSGFSYWSRLLKITISPKIEGSGTNGEFDKFDDKNSISIHLSQAKARILYDEIVDFMKDNNKSNSVGVASGTSGLITLSNGKEFGVNNPVLVIRKMDGDGKINSSYAYQFNISSMYNSIRNFNEKTLKYDTVDYNNLEIDSFLDVLRTYYESMTYASAYTVVDALRFEHSRVNTKLDLLMDKNGIERKGGNNNGGGGKSFFQRSAENDSESNSASRGSTTLDDISLEDE